MDGWFFLAMSSLENNDVTFGFVLVCARCQLFSGGVLLPPPKEERLVAGSPE